jgi:hypothetical protein
MAGPILRGGQHASLALEKGGQLPSASSDTPPLHAQAIPEEFTVSPLLERDQPMIISPSEHRFVDVSPAPLLHTPRPEQDDVVGGYFVSAPAIFGSAPRELSAQTPEIKHSLDAVSRAQRTGVAKGRPPFRGVSDPALSNVTRDTGGSSFQPLEQATPDYLSRDYGVRSEAIAPVRSERKRGKAVEVEAEREDILGEPFKVEWLCTERLPFHRTRHLRNLWNHDREVKVSRDGTELEPNVGQKLLDNWRTLAEQQTSRRGDS